MTNSKDWLSPAFNDLYVADVEPWTLNKSSSKESVTCTSLAATPPTFFTVIFTEALRDSTRTFFSSPSECLITSGVMIDFCTSTKARLERSASSANVPTARQARAKALDAKFIFKFDTVFSVC